MGNWALFLDSPCRQKLCTSESLGPEILVEAEENNLVILPGTLDFLCTILTSSCLQRPLAPKAEETGVQEALYSCDAVGLHLSCMINAVLWSAGYLPSSASFLFLYLV